MCKLISFVITESDKRIHWRLGVSSHSELVKIISNKYNTATEKINCYEYEPNQLIEDIIQFKLDPTTIIKLEQFCKGIDKIKPIIYKYYNKIIRESSEKSMKFLPFLESRFCNSLELFIQYAQLNTRIRIISECPSVDSSLTRILLSNEKKEIYKPASLNESISKEDILKEISSLENKIKDLKETLNVKEYLNKEEL
jgi:hypothetical protein